MEAGLINLEKTQRQNINNNLDSAWPKIKKLMLAEITKMSSSQIAKIFPHDLHARLTRAKQLLVQICIKPKQDPKPTAMYFKNLRRGALGAVHWDLRECLPGLALPGIDFVGNSIMEVKTDEKLKRRVEVLLIMTVISLVPAFAVLESEQKTITVGDSNVSKLKKNLEADVRRPEKNVGNSKKRSALN